MHPLFVKYFQFIRRALSPSPKGSSLGLDIGADTLKLVELKKTEKGFNLLDCRLEPFKGGDIKAVFKKILGSPDPAKTIHTSLYGRGTLIRYIETPRMSLDDLKKSFTIEIDRYFPFPADQIYMDCAILPSLPPAKHMSVVAAVAKKSLVDERVKLLSEMGYPVEFIGINAAALMNTLNLVKENESSFSNAVVALLDLGETVSNLNILMNLQPCFTRDILIGAEELTKAISHNLSISLEEAKEIKEDPKKRKDEILKICESQIANLIQEIRLSFDYFTTEKNKEVTELLLTGGGAMLQGLVQMFEKSLEVKVRIWEPLSSLKMGSPAAEEIKRRSPQFSVALGLALEVL